MKVYDSKVQQTCKICDCTFKNNKSGRFTSHLMNEHNYWHANPKFYHEKQKLAKKKIC